MADPITLMIAGGALVATSVAAVGTVAHAGHTIIQDHRKPKPPKNSNQQASQQVQYTNPLVYAQSPGCPTPGSYVQGQPQGYFHQAIGPNGQPMAGTPGAATPYNYSYGPNAGMMSPPIAQTQMMPQYQYMIQPQMPAGYNSPPPSYAYAVAQAPEKKHWKWF